MHTIHTCKVLVLLKNCFLNWKVIRSSICIFRLENTPFRDLSWHFPQEFFDSTFSRNAGISIVLQTKANTQFGIDLQEFLDAPSQHLEKLHEHLKLVTAHTDHRHSDHSSLHQVLHGRITISWRMVVFAPEVSVSRGRRPSHACTEKTLSRPFPFAELDKTMDNGKRKLTGTVSKGTSSVASSGYSSGMSSSIEDTSPATKRSRTSSECFHSSGMSRLSVGLSDFSREDANSFSCFPGTLDASSLHQRLLFPDHQQVSFCSLFLVGCGTIFCSAFLLGTEPACPLVWCSWESLVVIALFCCRNPTSPVLWNTSSTADSYSGRLPILTGWR